MNYELLFGWIFKPITMLFWYEVVVAISEVTIVLGVMFNLWCLINLLRKKRRADELRRYPHYTDALNNAQNRRNKTRKQKRRIFYH